MELMAARLGTMEDVEAIRRLQHAYGYYLEALLDFASITGKDPLTLGKNESVAEDMGFSAAQTTTLQQIAHDEMAARP